MTKPFVAKSATPAAIAMLRQATALAPWRRKATDGLLPSIAHLKQSPNSDHNTGLAVDLTHDPKHGIDCAEIFQKLKEDERVEYLIFNNKIWSRKYAKQGDRKYTGSNPHKSHIHVSIRPEFANDTSPWFWWKNQPSLTKQIVAEAIGGMPKKKVAKGTKRLPVCTCCEVHGKKGK
jgi:hypothetical protein